MFRNCSMEDISDGRLYDINDMARLGCNDCQGCFKCCTDMGNSIVLDPLDVFRIRFNSGESIEGLLQNKLELNIVDGVILPNIRMSGTDARCPYLNEEGRCYIHEYRPECAGFFRSGDIMRTGTTVIFFKRISAVRKTAPRSK